MGYIDVRSFIGDDQFADLLLYKNAPLSGGLIVGVTLFYYLFELSGMMALSVLAYGALFMVATTLIWAQAAPYLNRPPPPVAVLQVDDEFLCGVAKSLVEPVNVVLFSLAKVLSGKDIKLSGKVIVFLYMVSKVVSLFSCLTLAYLTVLFAFTVPVGYNTYQKECDAVIKIIVDQCNEWYILGKEYFNEVVVTKLQHLYENVRHPRGNPPPVAPEKKAE